MGFGSTMMDTELGSGKKYWHGINMNTSNKFFRIVLIKIFNHQL